MKPLAKPVAQRRAAPDERAAKDAQPDRALGAFPAVRMRRNRKAHWSRRLVAENTLTPADLIWPIFRRRRPERARPRRRHARRRPPERRGSRARCRDGGGARHSRHRALPLRREAAARPIDGSEALQRREPVCRAMRAIKQGGARDRRASLDVALDPYTSHGHDGLMDDGGVIVNDETLAALCAAGAGAGRGRRATSRALRHDGRPRRRHPRRARWRAATPTCRSWPTPPSMRRRSTGRSATPSAPTATLKGDKRTYQMDPANSDEALREVALDIAEGADMVMVKPGMPYLDIVRRVKDAFGVPTFAYQVSGEYAMLMAAAAERLARRRQGDAGEPDRLQARRRRRHPHLLRAAGGAAAEGVGRNRRA